VRKKVTIVGIGNTGSHVAARLANKGSFDIVLLDLLDGLPQGRALDILEAGNTSGHLINVAGAKHFSETANSNVVVIAAGVPRKPGMSREDLLHANQQIVQEVTVGVAKYSPDCILVLLTNPIGAMCYTAYRASGVPEESHYRFSGCGYGTVPLLHCKGIGCFSRVCDCCHTRRDRLHNGSPHAAIKCFLHSSGRVDGSTDHRTIGGAYA